MSSGIRRPLISTLRARLTLWYLGILALSLVLFAGLLYGSLTRDLYRHHDDELAQEAARLARALTDTPVAARTMATAVADARPAAQVVIVRGLDGELLTRAVRLSVDSLDMARLEAPPPVDTLPGPRFFTVELERLGGIRFIVVPVGTPVRAFLEVGDPIGDVSATLRSVGIGSVALIPVVLLLTSFGGWIIARRALAPIASIDSTIAAIQATDLSRRIEVHPSDEELARLVTTVNRLLDRLEQAFSSLREFAGDVSHQLQTPLTVMKGTLELGDASTREATSVRAMVDDLLEEVNDMAAIVRDLRSFSLADAELPNATGRLVDLAEICSEAADIIGWLAEAHGIRVETAIQPGVTVPGDAVRLKQVVLNLGDNAVKYTPRGGRVQIELASEGGQARLSVIDTGTGIPEEHLSSIFERFYRLDHSRAGVAGTGLGLAIVKRIVEVHRGTVTVNSRPGEGSTFTVHLPLV